jgi:hypothetical protein
MCFIKYLIVISIRQGPVVGSCEYGSKHLDVVKGGGFFTSRVIAFQERLYTMELVIIVTKYEVCLPFLPEVRN